MSSVQHGGNGKQGLAVSRVRLDVTGLSVDESRHTVARVHLVRVVVHDTCRINSTISQQRPRPFIPKIQSQQTEHKS